MQQSHASNKLEKQKIHEPFGTKAGTDSSQPHV